MTIMEAISQVDSVKQNTYKFEDKVVWLSRVDQMIKTQIIDTHEGSEKVAFTGYGNDTSRETVLLAPPPFDELYLRWLEMQIDYARGEYQKYNNSAQMFNTAFQAYANHYNRSHMPRGQKIIYF